MSKVYFEGDSNLPAIKGHYRGKELGRCISLSRGSGFIEFPDKKLPEFIKELQKVEKEIKWNTKS